MRVPLLTLLLLALSGAFAMADPPEVREPTDQEITQVKLILEEAEKSEEEYEEARAEFSVHSAYAGIEGSEARKNRIRHERTGEDVYRRLAEDWERRQRERKALASRAHTRATTALGRVRRLRNRLIKLVDEIYFGESIHLPNLGGPRDGEPRYDHDQWGESFVTNEGEISLGPAAFKSIPTLVNAKGTALFHRQQIRDFWRRSKRWYEEGNSLVSEGYDDQIDRYRPGNPGCEADRLRWQVENADQTGLSGDDLKAVQDRLDELEGEEEPPTEPPGEGDPDFKLDLPHDHFPGMLELRPLPDPDLKEGKDPQPTQPKTTEGDEASLPSLPFDFRFTGNGTTYSFSAHVKNNSDEPVVFDPPPFVFFFGTDPTVQGMMSTVNVPTVIEAGQQCAITINAPCVKPLLTAPTPDTALYPVFYLDLTDANTPRPVPVDPTHGLPDLPPGEAEPEVPRFEEGRVQSVLPYAVQLPGAALAAEEILFEKCFFEPPGCTFVIKDDPTLTAPATPEDDLGLPSYVRIERVEVSEPETPGPFERAWRSTLPELQPGAPALVQSDPIVIVEDSGGTRFPCRTAGEDPTGPPPGHFGNSTRVQVIWTEIHEVTGEGDPPGDRMKETLKPQIKEQVPTISSERLERTASGIVDEVMGAVEAARVRADENEKADIDFISLNGAMKGLVAAPERPRRKGPLVAKGWKMRLKAGAGEARQLKNRRKKAWQEKNIGLKTDAFAAWLERMRDARDLYARGLELAEGDSERAIELTPEEYRPLVRKIAEMAIDTVEDAIVVFDAAVKFLERALEDRDGHRLSYDQTPREGGCDEVITIVNEDSDQTLTIEASWTGSDEEGWRLASVRFDLTD